MRIAAGDPAARVNVATIDLSDFRLYTDGDAHLAWQTLRADCPVYWNERPHGRGFWAVTRRADVRRVLSDHETFSSTSGNVLGMIGVPDPSAGKMIPSMDPPRHQEVRRPLGQPLSAHAAPGYAGWVREIVRQIVTPAWDGAEFDAATAFARLPVAVIARLMAFPDEDVDRLLGWIWASAAPHDPHFCTGSPRLTVLRSHFQIMSYLSRIVRLRRRNPGDDAVSRLLDVQLDGRPITDEEIVYNCYSVLLGGTVTTSQAVTATLVALADQHGGEGRWAPGTPIEPAVDEAIRWSSPTMHFMRHASRDVEMHGVKILAGQPVTAWIASANRDETVFTDAYRFDPTRAPNPHLGFGSGVHRCVGFPVARLALRIVFEEFFSRLTCFELAAPPVHLVSNSVAGIVRLPMRLGRPAPAMP